MKLWIRSQRKVHLLEVNSLRYKPELKNTFDAVFNNDYTKQYTIYGNDVVLGIYETQERCLEIIDEIQKLLLSDFAIFNNSMPIKDVKEAIKQNGGIFCFNNNAKLEHHSASTIVYEMPEE